MQLVLIDMCQALPQVVCIHGKGSGCVEGCHIGWASFAFQGQAASGDVPVLVISGRSWWFRAACYGSAQVVDDWRDTTYGALCRPLC